MNQIELLFRKKLIKTMGGVWLPTIHEESKLNPGIPDLSYVMVGGNNHETGWLELKAGERAEVEPSQHAWIERRLGRIPVHFLWFRQARLVCLYEGADHRRLRNSNPIMVCDIDRVQTELTTALKQLTYRGVYGII